MDTPEAQHTADNRQILRAHRGEEWIDAIAEPLPEEQRRSFIGIDAEKIVAEHLDLTNLLTLVRREWVSTFSKAFSAGPKAKRLSIEPVVVLVDPSPHTAKTRTRRTSPRPRSPR